MQRVRCATLLIGTSLAWGVVMAGVAGADPLPSCRDLALRYGTAPAQMDTDALAALGTCIMNTIQKRSSPASQAAPPEPPQEAAAESPIDRPGWGQWLALAPWSDDKAETHSWGDD